MAEALALKNIYLDNIEEFVFDDGRFVTYKWLACKMGVHVNRAKQMLYHFLQVQEEQGRIDKVHPVYFISGLAPQKWINSIGPGSFKDKPDDEDDCESSSSEDVQTTSLSPDLFAEEEDEEEAYQAESLLIMLVRGKDLEKYKKKFSELFSIHVYGVSKVEMTRKRLHQEVTQPVRDDEGRGPGHYGPIKYPKGLELKVSNPRQEALIQNIQEVKARVQEQKEKLETTKDKFKEKEKKVVSQSEKDEFLFPNKNKNKGSSSEPSKSTKEKDKDRLKNMFAAVSLKPKVEKPPTKPEVEKVTNKKKTDPEESSSSSKKWTTQKGSSKAAPTTTKGRRESESKKRKRIRDVLSSEEEESEGESQSSSNRKSKDTSSDEAPDDVGSDSSSSPSPSPIPRRTPRPQIDSDSNSDDDFQELPKLSKEKPIEDKPKGSGGKRRVLKTVPKRYVDEEGFLVVEEKKEMVSETDSEEGEPEPQEPHPSASSKSQDKKKEQDKVKVVPSSSSSRATDKGTDTKDKDNKKKMTTESSSKGPPVKSKQASITSFFQKKDK